MVKVLRWCCRPDAEVTSALLFDLLKRAARLGCLVKRGLGEERLLGKRVEGTFLDG